MKNQTRKGPVGSADKARILFLLVALFAVVGMMWLFNQRRGKSQGPTVVKPLPPPVRIPAPGSGEKEKKGGKKKPSGVNPEDLLSEPEDLVPPDIPLDPPAPVYKDDPAKVLAAVKDETTELEPEALAYLLYKVRTTPPDDPERKNAPWTLQEDMIPKPEDRKAGKHPLRGKWVKIIGTLQGNVFEPEIVKKPGPSGVHRIYRNFVSDASGRIIKVYTIYDEPRFARKDDVETVGVFFKLHAYENQLNQMVAVPTVIADRFHAFTPPPKEFSWLWDAVVPGILVVAGFAMIVILVFGGTRGLSPRKRRRGLVRKATEEENES